MANKSKNPSLLRKLAVAYGLQLAYYDVRRKRHESSTEALLAMLKSMGAPLETLADVPDALKIRSEECLQRLLEPVVVAWEGIVPPLELRAPGYKPGDYINYNLQLEKGGKIEGNFISAEADIVSEQVNGSQKVSIIKLSVPDKLPWGYHILMVTVSGHRAEAMVISAPHRAYAMPGAESEKIWGVFLPLYALQTGKNFGSGQYTDLVDLISWVAGMGGRMVGTLPLLPSFFNGKHEYSPYLPVSRLAWNEFYLDVNALSSVSNGKNRDNNRGLVDYSSLMTKKRSVLEKWCGQLHAGKGDDYYRLMEFTAAYPVINDYASFMAACEKQRKPWQQWHDRMRAGNLTAGDYQEEVKRYYLCAQWLARQQLGKAVDEAKKKNLSLYLDLPLGVHPEGFDAWREQAVFMRGMCVGAPPDTVFTCGQSWGFPALHPEKIREQHYRYVRAYLRHHLSSCGMLRIDHIMGLHRLFCIPVGMEALQGVYLRYPAEELYAILTLESQHHRAVIVGENLGTVPSYVKPAMSRHGLNGMYVLQYEMAGFLGKEISRAPADSVASFSTHDMFPFAAYWKNSDFKKRLQLGLVAQDDAVLELKQRKIIKKQMVRYLRKMGYLGAGERSLQDLFKACLAFLSATAAKAVMVNLENLWLETKPQNIPGTSQEYPNWRRKVRYTMDEFSIMPEVTNALRLINGLRRQRNNKHGTQTEQKTNK